MSKLGFDWRWWLPKPVRMLRIKRLRQALGIGLLAFLCLDLLFPLPASKPYSPQVLARDGSLLRAYLSPDDKWRMQVQLDEVPVELPAALVAKEDRWFWYHPGVNMFAIGRALWDNATSGARMSGASTITMQVARLLEPKPRTLGGKLQEVFRAFQLEWHHSKTEILEMYMTYLPYGGNVEGVKAASYLYFERPPKQLSLAQCMLLTVIPNRPNSLRPDAAGTAAVTARNKWLRRFSAEGIFPAVQLADALAEGIPVARHELAYVAPQFCQTARQGGASTRLVTTLDPRMQQLSQSLLHNHVARHKGAGIGNGAVLVVDNRTMEVMAYCGSADFDDKLADGEVDGVQSVRSPGSTLKPFIYAMAFDQGLLTPGMKVLDIPTEFSDFSPVNYDRNFRGEIDAADALRYSLNLPAVRLLNQVGLRRFVHALRRAGFQSIDKHYRDLGLSLALGGCGATLAELVRAYAALANGGLLRDLRTHVGGPAPVPGLRVCSPEAAYIVSDILSGIQRPDIPASFLGRSKLPRVAWKTGTSFGRRDAWCVGYNPRYTIGVWMGNMDGKPVLEMSGSKTAVPLMLELFNVVDYDAGKAWLVPPPGIRERLVCTESGMMPGPACQHLRKDLAIVGVSPQSRCNRSREVYTDSLEQVQYCMACLPQTGFVKRSYAMVSPELALWMDKNQIAHPLPPAHNPECSGVFHDAGPEIHSPVKNKTYYVEEGQEIMLQATPDPSIQMHYWFANTQYLGSCLAGGKLFFQPPSGHLEIICMDDKGRSGHIGLDVELL
jgi:penicillin-binding protein 1C